jgi:F0F1-type ATP synthase membrane subunit b/b'
MTFYLIILIGIVLIFFNYNAIKKDKKSFNNILGDEINNMDEFKVLLEETKEEFNEVILELRREIQDINDKFNATLKINKKDDESSMKKVEVYDKIDDNKSKSKIKSKTNKTLNTDANTVKINEVEELMKQGLNIDEIAERLNVGKGEVLLIKELYLKS